MDIRKLTKEEIAQIYKEYMSLDFPPEEIKPLERINFLFDRGFYMGYGLVEKEQIVGYAFLTTAPKSKSILLDYYAICKEYRAEGKGTVFLSMLKEELKRDNYEVLIIEIESIKSAKNEYEEQIRSRRRDFYINNHIRTVNEYVVVFETEFELLYYSFDKDVDTKMIIEEYRRIYQNLVPEKLYKKHCFI